MIQRDLATTWRLALSLLVGRVLGLVRGIAFWTAILLPFTYVPLLLGDPPETLFGTLLALNVVALVVGHGHRRQPRERRRGQ